MHVLLAVYNGAAHLQEQLDSLARQTGVEVVLHVSDDGSVDGSLDILRSFDGILTTIWPAGGGRGPTFNFLNLLQAVLPEVRSQDWLAFCDQDDIWHDDKLARAVGCLAALPAHLPLAYGAATVLVDQNNVPVGMSSVMRRPCTFANALVQCVAGANTQVMNVQAARLLGEVDAGRAFSHDWLCYQLVTGAGGIYTYEPTPCLRYRQHGVNVVGANQGLQARMRRLLQVFAGDYQRWNDRNVATLNQLRARLTPDSVQRLDAFERARQAHSPWGRWQGWKKSGVYRQTRGQTWILMLACLVGRL